MYTQGHTSQVFPSDIGGNTVCGMSIVDQSPKIIPEQQRRGTGVAAASCGSGVRCFARLWAVVGLAAIAPMLILLAARWAPAAQVDDHDGIEKAKSLSRAFRAAAKRVIPTVVTIRATAKPVEKRVPRRIPRENPFKGTPFEDFFEDHFPEGFDFPRPFQPRQGKGSGVIIEPSGIILTNHHVVEDADEVIVELADGRQFKAVEVKSDEQSDLAVVRIKADGPLPAATLGDSDALDIGDWVLAIGNPFELEMTVSAGIISAKGRSLSTAKRTNFLQTDAAINPGNSGGPLVNLDGEVVGINTAIASMVGGFQGVGFAIPINQAKWVAQQLIKTGTVQRAYLGVAIAPIDGLLARQLGVPPHRGVLVNEVFADTPAAAAGLKEGDVILSFAGTSVNNPRELQEVVERSPIDSKQVMEVLREGKKITVPVVVKALPKDFGARAPALGERKRPAQPPTVESEQLGMHVAELTDELARRLGHQGQSGVVITEVTPNGPADRAGLAEGMLIMRVGKRQVKSLQEFQEAIKQESLKQGILLLVRTPEGNRFVVLQQ
jgi:serine protease Do